MTNEPLVELRKVSVHFDVTSRERGRTVTRTLHALDDVDLEVERSTTLGLVGESGSGKSTLGGAILRRVPVTSGSVFFDQRDITSVRGKDLRSLRSRMQLVFQDPYASLNPRMKVGDIVAEPLVAHGAKRRSSETRERVRELLHLTGLAGDTADRYPHAFSGGQRQRIGIARALALHPEFIVADEPVSALDVSIQAQVVNLFQDLQEKLGLTYLFIAHDVNVIRHISDRIAVMYAGQIVESGPTSDVFANPNHPYTMALLSAVPVPDPVTETARERIILRGEISNPIDPPPGCRFASRCPAAQPSICDVLSPAMRVVSSGHWAACHFAGELSESSLSGKETRSHNSIHGNLMQP